MTGGPESRRSWRRRFKNLWLLASHWLGYLLVFSGSMYPGRQAGERCREILSFGLLVNILTVLILFVPIGFVLVVAARDGGTSKARAVRQACVLAAVGFSVFSSCTTTARVAEGFCAERSGR